MEQKKLFLLDAYALIFRAYYALIRNPRVTSTGVNTSAIFGFVNTLQDIIKRERPTHIAVCFDPQGPTFRHECYPEYKAGREATPEDIKLSVPYIKKIVAAYNIPIIEVPGFEADDVIGTLAKQAKTHGFETYLMTPDKDFGQLVDENVLIYRPSQGEFEVRGVAEVCEIYGIQTPSQVIDILALMGDKVDNIPGCPGVGEKTAAKLVQEFGSIENLIANTDKLKGALKTKVETNIEQIKFSKYLATICTDAPITLNENELKRKHINKQALSELFKELELRTHAKRIITDNEGNIGLDEITEPEPKTVAMSQPKTNASSSPQMSLFDFDDASDEPATIAPVTPIFTISKQNYQTITDVNDLNLALQRAASQAQVAVQLLSVGEDAMSAKLLGIAVAEPGGKAFYSSISATNASALSTLFSSKATIISNNVKRDIVLLHRIGVKFTAPYFDTAVAHYLLMPERPHSTSILASDYLDYACINIDDALTGKGRSKLTLADLPESTLANFACELASVSLELRSILENRISEENLTSLLTDIELPLIEVLADMEITGARIDVKALNDYSKLLTRQMNELEQECFELAGEVFNTASPMKVGEILFDKLKIDDKAKKTKSGQYSTTEDILMHLRDRHPLVGKILDLRGIRKLLSTYVNALPELINPETGRIHTTYNQTVTATGRLSSTNPNLQNIPVRSDEGKEIRKAFIPADGNLFFSADYSQIELRLVADMSHDETMVESFCHDADIHAITAAKIYHKPVEAVTSDERRKAKTANFGILYGISAFGLSERLQISRAESKMLIDGYFASFPGVKQYIDQCIALARESGYVTTRFGRRRMLPDINSRNAVVRGFSERNAVNAPIQGTAADIIKLAMVRIFKRFKQEGIQSKMILQVHDELNFDVIPAEIERLSAIVVEEMQGAYTCSVPLTASHAHATNWLDAH